MDYLRIIAAFGVLLVHCNLPWFSNGMFLHPELGHKLVMVFFVLSGFLIAYSASGKSKTLKIYTIDRFSRLYSVIIPALIFTYCVDWLGSYINPGFYIDQIAMDNQPFRFLMNFMFIQQIWNFCTKPSSNGVFWSISYEFWYYVLFGVFFFLKGNKRLILLALISLFVGLKILLLAPVWIMGVICFYYSERVRMNNKFGIVVFISSIILLIYLSFFYHSAFFNNADQFGHPPLFFSAYFVFDWCYGLLVAINIFSLNAIKVSENFTNKIPTYISENIRYLSSITFTLYMFHLPLLLFIGAVVPYDKQNYMHLIPLIVLVLVIVAVIASFTEKKRGFYKHILEVIFLFVEKKYKVITKTKEV